MTSETKGGLEAVKWIAFALMLGDHINTFLLDSRYPVLWLLGRLVFPLFALAMAEGLSQRGEGVAAGVSRRLFVWAALAQVPWAMFASAYLLNILFALWLGLVAFRAAYASGHVFRRVAIIAACFLASFVAEYGVAGFWVVLAALWWREEGSRLGLYATVLAVAALYSVNATFFGLLAIPVFLALLRYASLPRVRHAFYALYPAQWLVLAFARWAI